MPWPWSETQPHINFQVNLQTVRSHLWMLLGETVSKIKHIANAPLLPEVQNHLLSTALIKGAQATTAIEGNTLTEEEIQAILEKRSKLPVSRRYQEREVENVLGAFNELIANGASSRITIETILEFNRQILNGLEDTLDPGIRPGVIRAGGAVVGTYRCPPHELMKPMLDAFIDWLDEFERVARDQTPQMAYQVLRAVLAHLFFVWVHPFGDGNGRTARLMEFGMLLSAGVPVPAAHLLSHHYNRTRPQYYTMLERARTERNIFLFVEYAVQGFVDCLQEHIESIQGQQFHVLWTHLVREAVPAKGSAGPRRQELAVYLGAVENVPITNIRRATPELAALYGSKTDKTVTRDINYLDKMQLLVRDSPTTVRANRARVFSLLPHTAAPRAD